MTKKMLLMGLVLLPWLSGCKLDRRRHASARAYAGSVTDTMETDTSLIVLRQMSAAPLVESLSQLWKMEDASRTSWSFFFRDSVNNKRKYPELVLYTDFSATENARSDIRLGKWKLDQRDRLLLLNFSDGTKRKYFVRTISLQKLVVSQQLAHEEVTLRFVSDGLAHKQPADDPFHPSNNRWRIRPEAPETDPQILARVKQCVHFYSLFFLDNHQRGSTDISFAGLPNCFEWYNGGIGLPEKIDLDKKWINCFYSNEQAMRGYDMLRTLIERHGLVWPEHPTSWIMETHGILDQLYDKLGLLFSDPAEQQEKGK